MTTIKDSFFEFLKIKYNKIIFLEPNKLDQLLVSVKGTKNLVSKIEKYINEIVSYVKNSSEENQKMSKFTRKTARWNIALVSATFIVGIIQTILGIIQIFN